MEFNALSLVILLGVAQAFLLGIFLLTTKNRNRSSILFGIYILVEAIGLNEQFLHVSHLIDDVPHFLGISYALNILRAPLLLFFTISYFRPGFQFNPKQLLHLLPFALSLLLFLPLLLSTEQVKLDYIGTIEGGLWTDSLGSILFFIINNAIYMVYFALACRVVLTERKRINGSMDKTSIWVARLVLFFGGFFVISLAVYTLNGFGIMSGQLANNAFMLASSFTIQAIAWFLMRGIKLPSLDTTELPSSKELDRLQRALAYEKVYLDDGLTSEALAHKVGVNTERLSQLMKIRYNATFKEVVNAMRIEEAKRLIDERGKAKLNLLGIALDSGFNNKVTFYRAFKKNEGSSPSEYVKMKFS